MRPLIPLMPHRKAICYKWIFRLKEIVKGTINKYNAKLIAKRFHQLHGFDFHETFSPIIKHVTIFLILTFVITNKWPIKLLNVRGAFLNGIIYEEVYMEHPIGFISSYPSQVCRWHTNLYDLKQVLRKWFERLKSTPIQLGFKKSNMTHPNLPTHSILQLLSF